MDRMPLEESAWPDETGRRLRVLTYNVWFDPADYATRAALLLSIIRETDPDVVALQEVTERFLQILRNDSMVVSEGNAVEEELSLGGISRDISIKQLSHRNYPSPSPKRQIWTWDCNGGKGDPSLTSVARCILQSESRRSPREHSHESRYTLIHEPDMGPLKKYGTALLTKELPSAMVHEVYDSTDMDRSIMAVELKLCGKPMWVATTHLESAEGPGGLDNHFVRKDQMIDALDALGRVAGTCPVVFMGDMNPTRQCEEEWIVSPWRDAWLTLRPNDPGYTYDCVANPYVSTHQARIDKVLFRDAILPPPTEDSGALAIAAAEISIVGLPCDPPADNGPDFDPMCTPEPAPRPQVVPSDHFGLCCDLRVSVQTVRV